MEQKLRVIPLRQWPPLEVRDLHEAAVEWVSLAIQRAKPDERYPEELASDLIDAIDANASVKTVDQLVKWIEDQEEELSPVKCAVWAQTVEQTEGNSNAE